jgi:hypothetical protein
MTQNFVYDIPALALPTPRLIAYARNRRVLGKAVHPLALVRLHELWPQARVFVRHHWTEPTPEESLEGSTGRRITVVWIVKHPDDPDSPHRGGRAFKHPSDPWDRRRGIALAFNRALKDVSRDAKLEEAGYVRITGRGRVPEHYGPVLGAPSGPPARYNP